MRERDHIALREHRAEVEAEERAEREKRERPIREAVNSFNETSRKLAAVYRERLLGRVADPDRIPVDRELTGVKMSLADADAFNRREFAKFRQSNPDVHFSDELLESIGRYLEVNGLGIVSANMLAAIVDRYRENGTLPDPPEPATEVEAVPVPESVEPSEPELIDGYDLESGEPRKWTPRELDRLDSTSYRKALRLYKADLALPNRGSGVERHG